MKQNENTTSLFYLHILDIELFQKKYSKKVLEIHGPIKVEKYIQEIFWRTYWKGWLEHRPDVYSDYIIEKNIIFMMNLKTKNII